MVMSSVMLSRARRAADEATAMIVDWGRVDCGRVVGLQVLDVGSIAIAEVTAENSVRKTLKS